MQKANKNCMAMAHFNKTPPVAVRAAAIIPHQKGGPARQRIKRKPLDDLVKASGIPRRTFQKLSYRTDWIGVEVQVMCAFCDACGVDITKKRPLYEFLRQHGNQKLAFLTTRQRMAMDEAVKKIVKVKP